MFGATELERHPTPAAGAGGGPASDRLAGSRTATVRDPFGLTWWLAATVG